MSGCITLTGLLKDLISKQELRLMQLVFLRVGSERTKEEREEEDESVVIGWE